MVPILGYWHIRGIAEPIRFLLHYVGEEFEDRRYTFDSNCDLSEWLDVKYTLGLEFPNLPYYMDGTVKLSQSLAILRYLARKHGLAERTGEEKVDMEILEGNLVDLFYKVAPKVLMFERDLNAYAEGYSNLAIERLKQISDYLGDGRWLMGDRITYVDFMAYDALDLHRKLKEDLIASYPNLDCYLSRFESLDGVRKYMDSEQYPPSPWIKQVIVDGRIQPRTK